MIRPSMLSRLERCPGSVGIEAGVPAKEETSEFAEKGHRLHELISRLILNPADSATVFAACENDDEARIVAECVAAAQAAWADLTPAQQSRAQVRVERTLDLTHIGIDKGTPDFVIVIEPTESEDGLIVCLDWKTGYGWVPPARWNLQIMAYALGSVDHIGEYTAKIGIVQPMRRTAPDVWIASKEDLQRVRERVQRVIDEAQKPDAPICSGSWCEYCRAKMSCPARALVAAEVGTIRDPVATITALEGPARADLYTRLGEAIKIMESAKEQIDAAILAGTLRVDGYDIGEGKKGRFWSKPTGEVIDMLIRMAAERGYSADDIREPITVSRAEKLFGKQNIPAELIGVKVGNPIIKRCKV